jgi:putative transcriptional regulator
MIKNNLQGHLLAANPSNPRDELDRAVILLTSHTSGSSVGLQINRVLPELSLANIANNIGIWIDDDHPVYCGGSVGVNKIHVIHTNDWQGHTTVRITKDLCVTNDISVLAAISRGEGPDQIRACAGFWLWEDGQLDQQLGNTPAEFDRYKWETVPATIENVFESLGIEQWHNTLEASARMQVSLWF